MSRLSNSASSHATSGRRVIDDGRIITAPFSKTIVASTTAHAYGSLVCASSSVTWQPKYSSVLIKMLCSATARA